MNTIDDVIAKYSKGDDAYALKLKSTLRDAMGYSNYINKANAAAGKPLSVNLSGNITPSGVKSLVGGAMGMQNEEVGAYDKMARQTDSAAGTLASSLAAKGKAADKYRYDSSFVFHPGDDLDQKILDYTRNPYNEDGSVKSAQQFEAELNQSYGKNQFGPDMKEGVMSAGGEAPQYTVDQVKQRLADRLPHDYIGKEEAYSYRFNGMTEKQAAEEQLIKYSNMIAAGEGNKVPTELYPMAYHLLSDSEKKKLINGGGRAL